MGYPLHISPACRVIYPRKTRKTLILPHFRLSPLIMYLSKTKDSDGSLCTHRSPLMKIPLFFKPLVSKVCFLLVPMLLVVGMPHQAHAGFFSDMVGKIVGGSAQADEVPVIESTDGVTHNSQTVPLLEPTSTPLSQGTKDIIPVSIVEDQALEAHNGPLGPESDIEAYASSAKISIYSVKKGDTISSITKQFGLTEAVFLASNPDIEKSDKLKVGQKIVVIPLKGKEVKEKQVEKQPEVKKEKAPAPAPVIVTPPAPVQAPVQVEIPTPTPAPAPVVAAPEAAQPVAPQPAYSGPEGQPNGTITGGYIWPFPAGSGRVSQGRHGDNAFDFAAPKGTDIYAVQSGTVLVAHPTGYNGGYGLYVVINFDDGRQAIFGHMSKVLVQAGEVVKQGDVIGKVGSTGHSTGPHVHIGFHGDLENPYLGLKVNATGLEDLENHD